METAAALIKNFPNKEDLFGLHYGEKDLVCTYDGTINFNLEGYKDVVGAEKFTYDECLEI